VNLRSILLPVGCALIVTSLAACAVDKTPAEPSSRPYQSDVVTYRCEGGVTFLAAYLNIEGGESFATLNYKDKLVPMHISPAGSGALYVADDEQNSYRWHTKGDVGVLSFLEADHTAIEKTLLKNCNAIPTDQ
jgi:membrane-bound inhibitor of C-type lysozyme